MGPRTAKLSGPTQQTLKDPKLWMAVFDSDLPLARGCWSKEDISKVIVQNVARVTSKDDRTPMQFQALLDHWNVCNRLNHYLEAEQFVDLERLFKLFDSLFFGGRLSHCQLKLYPYLEVGVNSVIVPYSIRSTPGLYSSISISQSGLIARAAKRVESKSDREHRFRAMSVYADALVHQMLHAMFITYACSCPSCTPKDPSRDETHGESWQAAALAIEKCGILGWDFELDREASLAEDVLPGNKPSEKEIHRSWKIQQPVIEDRP